MINFNGIYSPEYNEKASMPYMGDSLSAEESENAISLEDAMKLFDALADALVFDDVNKDGCCARAHIMCRVMQDLNLTPKKSWAFSGRGDLLKIEMPNGASVRWGLHVAAVIPVRMPDNTVKNMVFDPFMFDGPVSLQEWAKVMSADPKNVQIADFGVPPKGHAGDYDPARRETENLDELARDTMTAHRARQSAEPRIVFPTEARQLLHKIKNIAEPVSRGKTWISAAVKQAQPTANVAAPTVTV